MNIDPKCYTNAEMQRQLKKIRKWKIVHTAVYFIIAMVIVGFAYYEFYSVKESLKWEWNTKRGVSATQFDGGGDGGDFNDLLGIINNTAIEDIVEWVSTWNTTGNFSLSDNEEIMQILNETLGNGTTLEDFINSALNGSISEDIVRRIASVWVDQLAESLPQSWFTPLYIFGTYKGEVPIRDLQIELFFEIGGNRAPILKNASSEIATGDVLTLVVSLGKMLRAVINASKPIMVDAIVNMLLHGKNVTSDDLLENFFDEIIPQLSVLLGLEMIQNIGGFTSHMLIDVNFGKIMEGEF